MAEPKQHKRKVPASAEDRSSKRQEVKFFCEGHRTNAKPYKRPPRQNPPIKDYKKVPRNWNSEDNDLDEK